MAENQELLKELMGEVPWLYHPRIMEHPGIVMDVGSHGWRYVMPFVGKKEIVGVDSCPVSKPYKGTTLIRCALAPCDGIIEIKGGVPHVRVGAQTMMPRGYDSSKEFAYYAKTITMPTLRARYPDDWASLKMNIEGAELLVLIMFAEPIADQMTIGFHDRAVGDFYTRSARDAVFVHLDQWYDRVQITETNDWWFFLRRNSNG